MGLRQFLDVVRALNQRVVVELIRPDGEHVQDDLRVLRIVLVPSVVQRLPRPGQADRRDQFRLEAGPGQVPGERAVVISRRLERDAHGSVVFKKQRGQAIEVGAGVEHRHSPTALPARHLDENLVAVLGDVDAYENGG